MSSVINRWHEQTNANELADMIAYTHAHTRARANRPEAPQHAAVDAVPVVLVRQGLLGVRRQA